MSLQGIDRLRYLIAKYRIINEQEMELFLDKELKKPTSLHQKIILDGQLHRLLRDVPLTVDERLKLHQYCKSFLKLPACES